MSDTLGKIVSMILAAVLLFIMPAMFIGLKEEKSIQIYVDDAASEFVDRSNAIGYISEENYIYFINRLNNTGLLYDVELVHSSKKCFPTGNNYNTAYEEIYTEDILKTLFPDDGSTGIYQMNEGDFLSVNLTNKTSTVGTKIYNFLLGRLINEIHTIKTTYGGYVGGLLQ